MNGFLIRIGTVMNINDKKMENFNLEIYKTWKKRIKLLGLSQQHVATYSGVSSTRLNQVINSQVNPTVDFIQKIENFLRKEEAFLAKKK